MSVPLRAEEARALFQRALDGELTAQEQSAFERALAEDAALAEEFQALRRVMAATSQLANAVPSVDLLSSVQIKLRARSGGRFYRDRFAERGGKSPLLTWALGASVVVVLVTLVWFGFESGLLGR